MRQFNRISLGGLLGLMAIFFITAALQAQAAPKPELLLVQGTEQEKAQQAKEAARPKEAEEKKQMEMEKSKSPNMQMEKQAPKSDAMPLPSRAGTGKIAGQTIRGKEAPDGD